MLVLTRTQAQMQPDLSLKPLNSSLVDELLRGVESVANWFSIKGPLGIVNWHKQHRELESLEGVACHIKVPASKLSPHHTGSSFCVCVSFLVTHSVFHSLSLFLSLSLSGWGVGGEGSLFHPRVCGRVCCVCVQKHLCLCLGRCL